MLMHVCSEPAVYPLSSRMVPRESDRCHHYRCECLHEAWGGSSYYRYSFDQKGQTGDGPSHRKQYHEGAPPLQDSDTARFPSRPFPCGAVGHGEGSACGARGYCHSDVWCPAKRHLWKRAWTRKPRERVLRAAAGPPARRRARINHSVTVND
jgi:hypothetical protein